MVLRNFYKICFEDIESYHKNGEAIFRCCFDVLFVNFKQLGERTKFHEDEEFSSHFIAFARNAKIFATVIFNFSFSLVFLDGTAKALLYFMNCYPSRMWPVLANFIGQTQSPQGSLSPPIFWKNWLSTPLLVPPGVTNINPPLFTLVLHWFPPFKLVSHCSTNTFHPTCNS